MRVVAYYRVSTVKQGQSGLGLEAQKDQVTRYVESVGGELLAEHVEVESGTSKARPVLAEAMAECRRHKAVLVIAKLDRLARNVAFVSTLLESSVEFIACDVPHADRMMLQLLSVFAEFEARMISERTKAALAAAKARGVKLGVNGRILAEAQIADATAFAMTMAAPIAEARRKGAHTLQAIADHLNSTGHMTREAGKFTPMTVARILRRVETAKPNANRNIAA